MSRLCALLLVLGLLLPSAQAADSTTVAALSAEPPGRWVQSYQAHGRSIEVNLEPYVPPVTALPILKVAPDAGLPDLSALPEGYQASVREDTVFLITLDDYHRLEMEVKANTHTSLYGPPFDLDRAYAEHNSLTLGEALTHFRDIMAAAGHGEWRHDQPKQLQANLTTHPVTGAVLFPEGYTFHLQQMLHGVPVLAHACDAIDSPQDGWPRYWTDLLYQVRSLDAISILGRKLKVTDTLAEDVPLVPFSAVRAVLEQEIMAGRLRKLYQLELGYALYNEPGAFRKPGLAWLETVQFYAAPVWALRCLYVNSPRQALGTGADKGVEELASIAYKTLLIDAQTGELLPRQGTPRRLTEYHGHLPFVKPPGK